MSTRPSEDKPTFVGYNTNIVCLQIRVIFFESVIKNCNDDSFSCVTHFPGRHDVQVEAVFGSPVLFQAREIERGQVCLLALDVIVVAAVPSIIIILVVA